MTHDPQSTAQRVTAKLHKLALESVELTVKRLEAVKSPPALSAVVMEHAAKLALDMAAYYRSKVDG